MNSLLPSNETERLAALTRYDVLDSEPEPAFDRVTQLVARLLRAPMASVSLIDAQRQWFKSCVGSLSPESPRDVALCAHAILADEILEVPDATQDARFVANPLVTGEPHIRFYAGAPLRTSDGYTLGTLCVMDTVPRRLTEDEKTILSDLAMIVVDELELRLSARRIADESAERKRAEDAQRQNQAKFRLMIENGQDIITILSAEGTIQYESPSVLPVLGYAPEELVGRNVFEFVHPDDQVAVATVFEDRKQERERPSIQCRFQHKNGSWRCLEATGTNLLDNPDISGIVVNSRDITDRWHHEVLLEESEQRYRSLFQNNVDAVVSLDLEGCVLSSNLAIETMTGFSAVELQGKLFTPLIVEADRARVTENFTRVTGGEAQTLEFSFVHRDGRCIEMRATGVPIVINERVVGAHALLRDITASKRNEERLRMLESAVVNANDAILITEAEPIDLPGPRIVYVNAAFTRMTGYTLDEVLGQTPRILQGPKTDRTKCDLIRESLKKWQPIEEQLLNYRKDGSEFWIELSIVPVADETGWFTHWIAIERDITNRKRDEEIIQHAQQEAEQARDEADRANRAKSEFLSRMSHELRTPLNAILGFGQLLEMDPLDDAQTESVDQIMKGGRHLLDLINEVLDIARIESGKLAMSPEPLSLDEVLREVAALVRPLAEARGITFDIPPQCGCYALADRQRLKQVLLNLFSNAVKYNRTGGSVNITCDGAPDGRLTVKVRDTGSGIAPEDMTRLFSPFERFGADNSGIEGTGLGLAFSKRLVEAMNGTLEAQSTLGEGSTFIVSLPQAHSQLSQFETLPPASIEVIAAENDVSCTILYIEDNPSNLRLLERVLSHRSSIRLIGSKTGRGGLEDVGTYQPDVILLDLHLPDISGQEVLRALREDPATRHVPVVVVSADGTAGQAQRLLNAGAQRYVTKPFDVANLLQALEQFLPQTSSPSSALVVSSPP